MCPGSSAERWPGRRNLRGFSLIELALVIGLLGVMAAVAIPRYAASIARNRALATANRIASDLRYAQQRARLASTARTVTFDLAARAYTLDGLSDPDHPACTYQTRLTEPPYEIGRLAVDLGGDAVLTFDGFGVPDGAGEIKVQVGPYAVSVAIAAETGRITQTEIDPWPDVQN